MADPGVSIGGDRLGDFAVAMVQGTPGARALTVAVYDRPPGAPFIDETETYKRKTRPQLRWRPGLRPVGRADASASTSTACRSAETTGRRSCRATPLTRGQAHVAGRGGRPRAARPRAAACGRCGSTRSPPTLTRQGHRQARGRPDAEDHRHARRTRAAPGWTTSRSTTATSRRRTRRATTRHRYKRGTFTLQGRGRRQGGQRDAARRSSCASRSRDPARGRAAAGARRAPAADGHPQRDARTRSRTGAARSRVAVRARARARADRGGRRHRSTSAASPRAATGPRVSVDEEIARVEALIAALAGDGADLRRHLQAGGRGGRDRGGRGDRQRRLGAARPAAGRGVRAHRARRSVLMHTRGRAEGHAARPGDLRRRGRRRGRRSCASGSRSRARRAWTSSSSILDPGPDFAKTPAQTVAVLRRLDASAGARAPDPARRLAQGLRRRDHGPRARRARRRGRWRRSATGSTRAPRSCACTTSRGPRTTSPCARCCAASACSEPLEGLSPERYPDGVPAHLSLG